MKEIAAEGSVAGSDCGLPDNFIHFTGRSKPSELHDSDGELSLKLATMMEVSLVTMNLEGLHMHPVARRVSVLSHPLSWEF